MRATCSTKFCVNIYRITKTYTREVAFYMINLELMSASAMQCGGWSSNERV